jgi:hypothetical protein
MRDRMSIDAGAARVAELPAGGAWLASVLEARIGLQGTDGLHWLYSCLPNGLGAAAGAWIASRRAVTAAHLRSADLSANWNGFSTLRMGRHGSAAVIALLQLGLWRLV